MGDIRKTQIGIGWIIIQLLILQSAYSEIIKFKGDWTMQDHYKMQTGEKIVFDFKINNSNSINGAGNSINMNNTIYDMQIIDNNEVKDKKYSQLCKVNHMRVMPLYDQSKVIHQSQVDEYIVDFLIIKGNIIFYIFSNGKFIISSIHQVLKANHQPEIITKQLYEDQITQLNGQSEIKIAYHPKYNSIVIYVSTGDVYYMEIAQYLHIVQDQDDIQQLTENIQEQLKPIIVYQVVAFPKHEKAKKFIIENNLLIIISINGKVFAYTVNRNIENILSFHNKIFDIADETADFIDIDNHQSTIVLLDIHRGIFFYDYNQENEEIKLKDDLNIPLDGGVMISTRELNTIIVVTQEKKIIEYYVDYSSNEFVLNNEIEFEQHINSISVEENYLFVSGQSRNSNFFTPLNILKNTSHDLEQHQTMIKFGQHNIQLRFTVFQNLQKAKAKIPLSSQGEKNTNSKSKKLKGYKDQQNPSGSVQILTRVFVSLMDGNKIEVVPYQYERESIVCSSESTSKLLSNVNSRYEYTILYNSTDCQEKDRYYKVEKQQPTPIDIRKSYCSSHGTVTFEIDFTHYEQEEFEIGLVFICLFIFTAIVCFRHYKNKKLEKMFALKERMSTEKSTQKRKRLNLQYEPLTLLPNTPLKQD